MLTLERSITCPRNPVLIYHVGLRDGEICRLGRTNVKPNIHKID
jgi:hypothetical protein